MESHVHNIRDSWKKSQGSIAGAPRSSLPPPPPPPPPPIQNNNEFISGSNPIYTNTSDTLTHRNLKSTEVLTIETTLKSDELSEEEKFKLKFTNGNKVLQFAIWGHYMTYVSALFCFFFGIFACEWENSSSYGCKINGSLINANFIINDVNTCNSIYVREGETSHYICCDPNDTSSALKGNYKIGCLYILYSFLLLIIENVDYGWGLWYPNDTLFFKYGVSPLALLHLLIGIVGLTECSTCIAGACLVCNAAVLWYVASLNECGDGGRFYNKGKNKNKFDLSTLNNLTNLNYLKENYVPSILYNPCGFFQRIYNEDKLGSYFWVTLFYLSNFILFVYTLNVWMESVKESENKLLDGTLQIDCDSLECKVNRKMVRYGPISRYEPWAKACGACLNLDMALLIIPVTKLVLRKLNNIGVSFSQLQHNSDWLLKLMSHPLTRYIPLSKNIEFHKLIASTICVLSIAHVFFHYLNLTTANSATLRLFRLWGWDGTNYFTGAVITLAMYMIFTSAVDAVKAAKYEIFFKMHHFFIVVYIAMYFHAPIFFAFGTIPVLLYAVEWWAKANRGNLPYFINKVEWIPPVLALYFRPVIKESFKFKEGQYLYINCPHISKSEWHPFTISSAYDDLNNGPRVHIQSGEEVMEVPRPAGLDPKVKWDKYCLISQDYKTLDFNDLLDKGDTTYNDFISVHIKVHGLNDPYATTWTRRLKEYLELMNPSGKFPFYLSRRDSRNDTHIGRDIGPDGLPIIRIDGPHAAPAEHYANYGTVMLIAAGIGLTPCASILCALLKYKWRKDFLPEILHFYWIVRQNEIESFQWFVHMLCELSFELKRSRESKNIENRYYCEINIYVTQCDKDYVATPLHQQSRYETVYHNIHPTFGADELYNKLLYPTADSKKQFDIMKDPDASNRLQDIWIWNGRPHWDAIFKEASDQRQHTDIGVCFCGTPVIGADLRAMCEKYSNAQDDCLFSLHKENF